MKLIDEKGRLFGKVNLIDLLVVLLIVAVLAAVVWKLGGKKAAAAVTGADKKAVYTVEFEDKYYFPNPPISRNMQKHRRRSRL